MISKNLTLALFVGTISASQLPNLLNIEVSADGQAVLNQAGQNLHDSVQAAAASPEGKVVGEKADALFHTYEV